MRLPTVVLRTARNSLHPWIYNKMVSYPEKRLAPGTLVRIATQSGAFAGYGFFNAKSQITIRVMTEDPREAVDRAYFVSRIARARALREEVLGITKVSSGYRLVHSESDGLSGLVIDRFGDLLVVEPYSAGYLHVAEDLVEALRELFPKCQIGFRPDARTSEKEAADLSVLEREYPCPDAAEVVEHGIRYRVDLRHGHKTGFFLDQRDNRRFVREMAKGKRVLDLCCYTGGFALAAMSGGATSALGIDLDPDALRTAAENAKRNQLKVEFHTANVFDAMRTFRDEGRRYDLVILDPSKLASVRDELPRAMRTYGDLNRLAIDLVEPGGVLVTCSCSGLLPESDFVSIVGNAAAEAGVTLQIFDKRGAAPDHPWTSVFPEGRYLKVLRCRPLPGSPRRASAPRVGKDRPGPFRPPRPSSTAPEPASSGN